MLGGGGAFKGVPSQAGSALDETVYCTALQLLVLPICISWKRSFVFHVKGGGRWGGERAREVLRYPDTRAEAKGLACDVNEHFNYRQLSPVCVH